MHLSCEFATEYGSPSELPSVRRPKLDSVSPVSLAGDPYRLRSGASRGESKLKRPIPPLCGPDTAKGFSATRSDLTGTIAAARLRRCRLNRQNASRARATRTTAPPTAPPATAAIETSDLGLSQVQCYHRVTELNWTYSIGAPVGAAVGCAPVTELTELLEEVRRQLDATAKSTSIHLVLSFALLTMARVCSVSSRPLA